MGSPSHRKLAIIPGIFLKRKKKLQNTHMRFPKSYGVTLEIKYPVLTKALVLALLRFFNGLLAK